jgi:hypothetical protein
MNLSWTKSTEQKKKSLSHHVMKITYILTKIDWSKYEIEPLLAFEYYNDYNVALLSAIHISIAISPAVTGTVRPDWISLRMVSLDRPGKGHQTL